MKIPAFYDVTTCRLVEVSIVRAHDGGNGALKCWYTATILHDITFQKTPVFLAHSVFVRL